MFFIRYGSKKHYLFVIFKRGIIHCLLVLLISILIWGTVACIVEGQFIFSQGFIGCFLLYLLKTYCLFNIIYVITTQIMLNHNTGIATSFTLLGLFLISIIDIFIPKISIITMSEDWLFTIITIIILVIVWGLLYILFYKILKTIEL